MKRAANLYHYITDIDTIINMTHQVCKNVKNKEKVNKFETYKSEHIINIKNKLESKNYTFGKYNIFMITDPKCRIVMGQSIEDKIINHLVAQYFLVNVFEPKYINSMTATRVGKGSSYGIKLLKKYLNELKRKYDNFYVLKIDIKKYFYSLDHDILKRILKDNIKDQDALNALYQIIDTTNQPYINKEINRLKNKRIEFIKNSSYINDVEKEKLIQEVNAIPLYKTGKGCSIGNQTSQAFGLIYLYELSYYIKEELHIKYLVIYMDDLVLIHHDKEYLREILDKIKYKLINNYKLEINETKTRIDSIKNGIDFLGYRFLINKNNRVITKLRNRTKKNFKRKAKDINLLYKSNLISKKDYDNLLCSYKGLLEHGSCKNLYYKNMSI